MLESNNKVSVRKVIYVVEYEKGSADQKCDNEILTLT